MFAFWAAAGIFAAAAAGLILFRAARAARQGEAPDPTPVLYRRQLAEIDDLADRGLIGEAERKSTHAEAARRLLAAAEAPGEAWTTGDAGRGPVLIAVLAAPALALGLYLALGSPGFGDQPFAKRLHAWQTSDLATLAPAELAAVLNGLTKTRPNDPELYRYIALAEGSAQNPPAAVRALHKATTLAPERADLWTMLGEALVLQTGQIGPDAQAAFRESLKLDPTGVSARYHLGAAMIAGGDRDGGVADWRALLADIPASDPRREALVASIAEAEGAPAAPAVSDPQMAAIRGMVSGLAERLKADPDDAEGWVRLVRAYAVLGEAGPRDAALKAARARYASRPDVLNELAKAASAEPMQ
ncbi:MAG: c-type cytochrome biogenesis protein CcmI [Phenylobacterium sp.]